MIRRILILCLVIFSLYFSLGYNSSPNPMPNSISPLYPICPAYNPMTVGNVDTRFPYGQQPQGNVCVSADYYATPETMLGSWAMLKAVAGDIQAQRLPPMFSSSNDVVYAVGTAAIGGGGSNQLNGYCFALRFNDKAAGPRYMIFQSVNIGANIDSFDIYMAGGGSGNFPASCAKFWGDNTTNWAAHIQDYPSCEAYFNNFSNIHSHYSVQDGNQKRSAKDTLICACHYAFDTGFNRKNFSNVSYVPVTCPLLLTQVTGLRISDAIHTVGDQTIINLRDLTDNDFNNAPVVHQTTQMQDCKTPSSGYCGNVNNGVKNYEASISADLTKPLLNGTPPPPPPGNYCQQHPLVLGYCSWDDGKTSGGAWCNQSEDNCKQCGGKPKWWCFCDGEKPVRCDQLTPP